MNATLEQLSCQELVELVTDYFEGALSEPDRRRFEQHLAGCDGCHEYVEQMTTTIELAGTLTPADLSPESEAKLLAAFGDWKAR